MGHTPYGYRIEDGRAVIDEEQAERVRKLYRGYLSGLALMPAAKQAGIETWHGSAKRLLYYVDGHGDIGAIHFSSDIDLVNNIDIVNNLV